MLASKQHAKEAFAQTNSEYGRLGNLELESQIETQEITIRTLKGLLEQHREENALLLTRVDGIRTDVSVRPAGKENSDRSNCLRILELEKRLKFMEANNSKLAAEVWIVEFATFEGDRFTS